MVELKLEKSLPISRSKLEPDRTASSSSALFYSSSPLLLSVSVCPLFSGSTCGVVEQDRGPEVGGDLRLLCEKSQAMAVGRSGPLSENKRQPSRPERQDRRTATQLQYAAVPFSARRERGGVAAWRNPAWHRWKIAATGRAGSGATCAALLLACTCSDGPDKYKVSTFPIRRRKQSGSYNSFLKKWRGRGEMLQVAVPVPADRQTDRHRFKQTEKRLLKKRK